ncbi:hypothetical protein CPB84DRAFT_1765415 [Gymnopilus junonius]|uniref:Uncharacterized protein n=1 Tax=Gymnopilus junonius TaxID=109634 RepID=A0A9P5NV75_GYMJU|nr:hypothetical protein CPB84DRAFT_1765415 [Gymnopilus junonius]
MIEPSFPIILFSRTPLPALLLILRPSPFHSSPCVFPLFLPTKTETKTSAAIITTTHHHTATFSLPRRSSDLGCRICSPALIIVNINVNMNIH